MLFRRASTIVLLFTLLPIAASGLGFEALTLGFSEAWTGNAYVPTPGDPGGDYDFDVTGSEAMPIDPFFSVGARVGLVDGLLISGAVLSVTPAVQIGWRRYLLYDSGRVVPTQIETRTGAEGHTLGQGASGILTIRLPVPLGYELRSGAGHAFLMTVSPTFVFRIPAGAVTRRDANTDLSALYAWFTSEMRFLMPELALGYRFPIGESLEATVHVTGGVSVLDVLDTTLPWWDQTRLAIGVDLGLRPPFSGLVRPRDEELPPGIDPFPEDEES